MWRVVAVERRARQRPLLVVSGGTRILGIGVQPEGESAGH